MELKSTRKVILDNPKPKKQSGLNVCNLGLSSHSANPTAHPLSRNQMSMEEFNVRMETGLIQAKANQSTPVNEAFNDLIKELNRSEAL